MPKKKTQKIGKRRRYNWDEFERWETKEGYERSAKDAANWRIKEAALSDLQDTSEDDGDDESESEIDQETIYDPNE
jgi:hypothetical protein